MALMQLHMTPGSCSTGIHIILEELEAVFEAYVVNLPAGDHFKPDYVAINPKSTVPTLVRPDGTPLTEVVAIAYWLARANPRAGLWPAELEEAARALEAMVYIAGTIHGQGFARIFATSTFGRDPADHAEIQQLGREIVGKGFAVIDGALADRPFLAGAYSVADPILFYVAFWADKTGVPMPANIAAHYRRMLARPAVRRVLIEEGYNPAALGQG